MKVLSPPALKNEQISILESLLDLGNSLVTVRDQQELSRIIREKVRRLVSSDNIVITLYNRESGKDRIFMNVFGAELLLLPELQHVTEIDAPFGDELPERILSASGPLTLNMDELLVRAYQAPYISLFYKLEIKEFTGVAIRPGNELYGCVYFASTQKNVYRTDNYTLIKGIADQLSFALANIMANEEMVEREMEKSLLLEISEDMSAIRNKGDLMNILHDRLKKIFYFGHTVTILIDPVQRTYSGYIFDPRSRSRVHNEYGKVSTAIYSLEDGIMQLALTSREPVIVDLELLMNKIDVPEWVKVNYTYGIREMVMAQLNAGSKLIGVFIIFSDKKARIRQKQLKLIQGISNQLANTVSNILANEAILARENEKSILLALSKDIATVRNKHDLHRIINEKLKKILPVSHTMTGLLSDDGETYSAYLTDPQSASRDHPDHAEVIGGKYPIQDGVMDYVLASDMPIVYDLEKQVGRPQLPKYLTMNYECGMREVIFSALRDGMNKMGVFVIFSALRNRIGADDLSLIQGISSQLSNAIANIFANERIERQMEEITGFKQQLEVEKLYLQEEIQTSHNYGEIVGTSPVMQKIFELVSQVAESQTSVLIMGETGTGKELVARALHNTSLRKGKLMVKVNCATIPANLIESELFGHERGSFTGATERRIGKFELANNSTLFLDEIGELPLDLQVKLLRALQEKEIERVGGRSVIRTDVRIIAATNRDLRKEVLAGNFRSDLYYRLNVFPIVIPPLRQRKEDIPSLAAHFLVKHAKKGVRGTMNFSSRVMKELMAYNWPGNVRELEHLIERSILLTTGTTINQMHLPMMDKEDENAHLPDGRIKTIDEVEREHIISVLKICNGKVSGVGGAAEKLKIPATTLTSKIRRLGIKKGFQDKYVL